MRVRELLHPVLKVAGDVSVKEVAQLMDLHNVGSVLVETKGKEVGIVTERDILRKIVAKHQDPVVVKVSSIMTKELYTIDHEVDVLEASRMMDEKKIRRLLVTEYGKIIGKITANAISRNMRFLLAQRLAYTSTLESFHPEYTFYQH
ncbi:CBS domain-containing protein [Candidatus Woesearchaeota archaeon]|nr:CBS domain-containing protein [Candidatus Woesearchaeota archaeon]